MRTRPGCASKICTGIGALDSAALPAERVATTHTLPAAVRSPSLSSAPSLSHLPFAAAAAAALSSFSFTSCHVSTLFAFVEKCTTPTAKTPDSKYRGAAQTRKRPSRARCRRSWRPRPRSRWWPPRRSPCSSARCSRRGPRRGRRRRPREWPPASPARRRRPRAWAAACLAPQQHSKGPSAEHGVNEGSPRRSPHTLSLHHCPREQR